MNCRALTTLLRSGGVGGEVFRQGARMEWSTAAEGVGQGGCGWGELERDEKRRDVLARRIGSARLPLVGRSRRIYVRGKGAGGWSGRGRGSVQRRWFLLARQLVRRTVQLRLAVPGSSKVRDQSRSAGGGGEVKRKRRRSVGVQ
ncbi:uncharacterized protein A4U43_C01F27860 [Asparagus officinalis]|uniref:Uncharacterized protein n=1 Tax=Asparagus officinalis TaxID=4686 RepID=A0A5P1FSX8_ASPOF|nr:uncharacterized protein A4U43_C01F27860 [Asparagus officinalis]